MPVIVDATATPPSISYSRRATTKVQVVREGKQHTRKCTYRQRTMIIRDSRVRPMHNRNNDRETSILMNNKGEFI
uniref:Uncharacterized protein n=1 Tax=Heterorhabditis bacteriophora TaxID=37862 RepID=A0A1I7WQD3_HETBA